jgi:hypothetical protein
MRALAGAGRHTPGTKVPFLIEQVKRPDPEGSGYLEAGSDREVSGRLEAGCGCEVSGRLEAAQADRDKIQGSLRFASLREASVEMTAIGGA